MAYVQLILEENNYTEMRLKQGQPGYHYTQANRKAKGQATP
ncbi:hypothetical protein [Nitrosomonas sp. Nm34]|nr:hypothetical protein [Nitrosomonas sp. Nm34]SFI20738.1 hypothetical protein SAMN05428978_100224 [Nitrosomonas sp. Nm34]